MKFEVPEEKPSLKNQLDPELSSRESRSEHAVSLLSKLNADSVFDSPEHKEEFLKELTYDEIKRIGLLVNDVTRGKKSSKDFDGGNVLVQGNMTADTSWVEYLPPREADKNELLSLILTESRNLSPEDAGLLLGLGINAVHPFADGNGRSSRLMYTLLAEGYDGSPESKERIQNILSEEGRKYVDLNPDRIMHIAAYFLERKAGIEHGNPKSVTESWTDAGAQIGNLTAESLPVADEVSLETREKLIQIIENRKLRTVTFYKFLEEQDMLREPFINYRESEGRYERYKKPDKWTTIQIDEVLSVLDSDMIDKLIETSGNVRRDSVIMMTAFISRPDTYKINKDTTVKDYFVSEVEKYKENN